MGWIADLLKEIPSAARYKAELEEMEGHNTELQQKVILLELELNKLRQEIKRRDDIIQKEKSHDNLLDETQIKILALLSRQSDSITTDHIAYALSTNVQIILFHLQELENNKMVHSIITLDEPIEWTLGHPGRKYLIENNLIS